MQCAYLLQRPLASLPPGLFIVAGRRRNSKPSTSSCLNIRKSNPIAVSGLSTLRCHWQRDFESGIRHTNLQNLECSVWALFFKNIYSDQVVCAIQPLVSMGVNGIFKWQTSFDLWYLNSHNHRCRSLHEELQLKSLRTIKVFRVGCDLIVLYHLPCIGISTLLADSFWYSHFSRYQSPSSQPTNPLHPRWFGAKGSRAAKIF